MPNIFSFDVSHVRYLLHGLRALRAAEPQNAEAIDGTICWLKYQMVGKIKQLEPFMRNRRWIEDEIMHETVALHTPETDVHDCKMEDCKNTCRGSRCIACWRTILAEIHGEREHKAEGVDCKKT